MDHLITTEGGPRHRASIPPEGSTGWEWTGRVRGEGGRGGHGQALMFLGISFYCIHGRDKRRGGTTRRDSDDGWPLEFQRAGNHIEASVYQSPSLRNFCLQIGERRARVLRRRRRVETVAITAGISLE